MLRRRVSVKLVASTIVLSFGIVSAGLATLPSLAQASTGEALISQNASIDMEHLPKALGGSLTGTHSYKENIENYGEISVTANYDTGELNFYLPDGSIKETTYQEVAEEIYETLKNSTPEQQQLLVGLSQERFSKKDICPYLVSYIGMGQEAAWAAALEMTTINPAVGLLVALGNGFFWTWVGTHC